MPQPTRVVATDWGVLYATCIHPDQVRFSTDLTVGGQDSSLLINRIRYSCSLELSRGEIPEKRRSGYRSIDGTWQSNSGWYSLRRLGTRGDATAKARGVLYEQVLPVLAEWLHTADGHALLAEGDAYWRRDVQRLADDAEHRLTKAFHKVQDLRRAVEDGRVLTADEEQFLKHPYVLQHPHEHYPEPSNSTRHAAT